MIDFYGRPVRVFLFLPWLYGVAMTKRFEIMYRIYSGFADLDCSAAGLFQLITPSQSKMTVQLKKF